MRKNLINARKAQSLTQAQLAGKLGMTLRMYQHIESGTRDGRIPTWRRLQELLKVPEYELQTNYTV